MPEPGRRAWLAHFGVGVAIAVLATLVALALGASEFVTRIELATYDWRMRLTARPADSSPEIVIVAMNDDSIKRLEPVVGRWPWPRLVHAAVIENEGPRRRRRVRRRRSLEGRRRELTVKYRSAVAALALMVFSAPAYAQLGAVRGAVKRAEQVRDLQISSSEERELGSAVGEKVRERYGVVQDANVHRYVTLVGTAVAEAAGGSDASWTFIVLDTDAVNAFAAPGGFVHITRGALALIKDEAELAGVLGHEVVHITEKHTIRAIQKNKSIQDGC